MLTARLAHTDDLESLVTLRMEYFDSVYNWSSSDERDSIELGVRDYIKNEFESGSLLIAVDESLNCMAMAAIYRKCPNRRIPSGRVGEIYGVYTRPEHRHKGLGRNTMLVLIEELAKRDVDLLQLEASASGELLYQSLGFECDTFDYNLVNLRRY